MCNGAMLTLFLRNNSCLVVVVLLFLFLFIIMLVIIFSLLLLHTTDERAKRQQCGAFRVFSHVLPPKTVDFNNLAEPHFSPKVVLDNVFL